MPDPPPVTSATATESSPGSSASAAGGASSVRTTPAASASGKSFAYWRTSPYASAAGAMPSLSARSHSTCVGNEATAAESLASTAYVTLPSFASDSAVTLRCVAETRSLSETLAEGMKTVRSKPRTASASAAKASCAVIRPSTAARALATACLTSGPTGATVSIPASVSLTTPEKHPVVAALGAPARTQIVGRRTPRPSTKPRRE
mmetsp:Transcript_607/g.2162  ORF Transcript_607/g.2162 Transcript_607/m.2162 type:complete len:205 (-) Transcript_607:652-1266(-)